MAGIGDMFKELLNRQAEAMKQYQDTMSDSMKAWQDALGGMVGGSGEGSASEGGANPLMPDAAALAENYFAFAGKVLEQQHEFALKLIESMQPAKG